MAIFKDTTITDNGRALIANALGNNKQITFTRMVTSSKVYSDTTDVSKLINIDEIKQTVNLSRVSQEGTKVRLNAIFTNASVNSAYKIETIGLYGKIDSGNEILYSVTRAVEADTMPATNGINLATVEIDLITEINNSNGATMVINPSTLATLSTLQDYIKHEEKMNWMGTNGYGGLLQDAGTKKVGIAYYDKANKQMVVPTVENTLTYFEGSKFIPISDYQNAKKLENLFKYGNNWMKLPFGLIIQWGVETIPNGDNVVTLPTSYRDSNSYQIVVSDTGGGAHRIGTTPISGKQFRAYGRNPSNEFARTGVRWLTIGY